MSENAEAKSNFFIPDYCRSRFQMVRNDKSITQGFLSESQPVTSQQLKKSIPPKMIDRKRPKGVELKNKRVTTDGRL